MVPNMGYITLKNHKKFDIDFVGKRVMIGARGIIYLCFWLVTEICIAVLPFLWFFPPNSLLLYVLWNVFLIWGKLPLFLIWGTNKKCKNLQVTSNKFIDLHCEDRRSLCLREVSTSTAHKRDKGEARTHLRVLERWFCGRWDMVPWMNHGCTVTIPWPNSLQVNSS